MVWYDPEAKKVTPNIRLFCVLHSAIFVKLFSHNSLGVI